MQALLVYGKAFDNNSKQLQRACQRKSIRLIPARIAEVSASINKDGFKLWVGDRRLSTIDFCFLRSFGLGSYEQLACRVALMEQLELDKVLVINSPRAFEKAQNKYYTLCRLAHEGLPVPETFLTEMAPWAYRASNRFREFVYKPIVGSLGFGSMKFRDKDLAFNVFKTLERWEQPLHVQEFLHKPGRDIRVFVLDSRVVGAIYRVAKGKSWKTNVAQGGKTEALKLTSGLEEIALKAVAAPGLVYGGVDIVETEEGLFVLEVNGAPSWQGLQKATGIDVAELLVEYAVSSVKR